MEVHRLLLDHVFYPPPGFCQASVVTFSCWRKNCWSFFFFFNMPFSAAWGCASDFLKMLPKFKMATRGNFNFFVGAKTYLNFTIAFPTICRCAGDFKVLLELKMAATDEVHNFSGRKNACGNEQVISRKFIMATANRLLKY